MKTLLTLALCLLAIVANAANPSTKSFRGAGGITVTSNDTTAIITIDGSGVIASGTNSSLQFSTNGVAVSTMASNLNLMAGNNMVLKGTNIGSTAHINYGMASNLTFNTDLGPVVVGSWGDVWGISNVSLGHLAMWLPEVDSASEMFFQDNVIVGGIVQATNVTLTAIPGTGTNVGITAGGTLFRMTETAGGSGTIISNANVLFVDLGGNNTTAKRGRRDLPWATMSAAVAAAVAGDTVVGFPGEHQNCTNILKNGVNLFGYPGAWLTYTNQTNDTGRGILDDRWAGSGGVTSVISGFSIRHSLGMPTTNGASPVNVVGSPTNVLGPFSVTNPLSFVQLKLDRIEYDNFGLTSDTAALCLFHGRGFVHVNEIVGVSPTRVIGFDSELEEDVVVGSSTEGTWWKSGDWHVTVTRSYTTKYSVYPNAHGTNEFGNFWYSGDLCVGKLYGNTATLNPNWKSWINIKEVQETNGGAAVSFIGGGGFGKLYLKVDKIGSSDNLGFDIDDGWEVWLYAQKISAKTKWLDLAGGTLHAHVIHFEDLGTVNQGIHLRGGTLDLKGNEAVVTNVTGSAVYFEAGSTANISGLRMSTLNSTNAPVVVATNGLVLANCTLLAGSGSFSVQSRTNMTATNQTVNLQGSWANKPETNSISYLVGPWTVDSNVR